MCWGIKEFGGLSLILVLVGDYISISGAVLWD